MDNTLTVGETAAETRYIEVSKIGIPQDARPHSPEDLASLAADMAKEGQLQEIVVVPVNSGPLTGSSNGQTDPCTLSIDNCLFMVVAGVGRVLAARQLNWEKIRCLVKDNLSDFDRLRITFAENEERENVSPIYQAQLLDAMKKAKNCDQRELAAEIGKTEANVSQYLSLLSFSTEVQKNLNRFKFSLVQLLEIRKLEGDEAQLKAAKEIEEGGLTVKETKKAVQKHLEAQGKAPKAKKPTEDLAWKGDEIAINRCFKPAAESVQDYIAWLAQALPAFAETKPARTNGHSGQSDAAVVEKMVEPVKEAVAVV
jgi:ParB/RepB/Spo0J family partition protein